MESNSDQLFHEINNEWKKIQKIHNLSRILIDLLGSVRQVAPGTWYREGEHANLMTTGLQADK